MNDIENSASAAGAGGYLSEEDKKKFTIVVGVLGAVFFLLQFLGPMVAMFALMPTMMRSSFRSYDVDESALYRNEVYLVETVANFARSPQESTESRLVKLAGRDFEEVVPLEGWRPSLLADGERLWLISSERIATLEKGTLTPFNVANALGDICRPFLYRGSPAVIETRPEGSRLMSWGDVGWEELRTLDLDDGCGVQPVAAGDDVWLFRRKGDTLFSRNLSAETSNWDVVLYRPNEWYALALDGRPAVASLALEQGFRVLRNDGNEWVTLLNAKTESRLASSLAVFPLEGAAGGGPSLLVVSGTFPGSVRRETWNGDRLVDSKRFGRSFPFPGSMTWIMMLPQLGGMLTSLVLAVILASLMRAHRVTTYAHQGVRIEYASLTRRALAQIADGLVFGLPAAIVLWSQLGDMESLFESGPGFPLRFLALWAGSLVWGLLLLLGYSVTEGRFCATPGKWALGIRVLGTDLEPCGFGRALVRNLLKLIDGFFNYLVGILMVAYTPEWQRLGDLAARTVVVRWPAGEVPSSTAGSPRSGAAPPTPHESRR